MTVNPHKFYIPLVIVAVVLAVVGFISWLRAHDAMLNAIADSRIQGEIRKHIEQDVKDAQSHFDKTGKDTEKQVAQVKATAAKPLTSAEFQAFLKGILPQANVQPIIGPNGVPMIAVPDTPEVRAEIVAKEATCQINAIGLKGCTSQLSDMTTMRDKAFADRDSWKDESGKWQTAAGHKSGFRQELKEWGIRIGFLAGGYAAGRIAK